MKHLMTTKQWQCNVKFEMPYRIRIGPVGLVVDHCHILELSAMSFNCSFPWFVQPADLQRNVVYKQKSFHANKSPAGHVISSKNLKQQDPNEPNKYLLFSHLIFAYQTS